METIQKRGIANKLAAYCSRFNSQNKAANSLTGVSSATISQVLNNNWASISDEMWQIIASQIGYKSQKWNGVETLPFRELTRFLTDAQSESLVMAITASAGSGKTFTISQYCETNKRAYHISCCEYWNKKDFLLEVLKKIGRDRKGGRVATMMEEIVSTLQSQSKSILIIDEADKLSNSVLNFFITLYNRLEDECAIILIATSRLSDKITRGVDLNKTGFNEIYSRIGRKFIPLEGISGKDIADVCVANGVDSPRLIDKVIEDSESDLRRVKRLIFKMRK